MKYIRAQFEVVTPMFLGGADHEAGPIRPASVKAEILFWWRALNYHRFSHAVAASTGPHLNEFYKEEQRLFGSPSKGQGVFSLTARWVEQPETSKQEANICDSFRKTSNSKGGVNYLGYGVIDTKGKIEANKSCVKAGATFAVELIFKPGAQDIDVTAIKQAVEVMGMLGGLGSRKRRGWGSLAPTSLETGSLQRRGNSFDAELDPQAFMARQTVEEFDKSVCDATSATRDFVEGSAPLSCFGKNTLIHRWAKGFNSAFDAMEALGHGYQLYRAWGRKRKHDTFHMVQGVKAHQNFSADHHWYRRSTPVFSVQNRGSYGITANNAPERANFGLPLGFEKGLEFEFAGDEGSRRASPLLFHIAKTGLQFYPVATWLNTQFLPGKSEIKIASSGKLPFTPDYSVISDYLEGKSRPGAAVAGPYRYFDGIAVLPAPVKS